MTDSLHRVELELPCALTDEEVQTRGRMLGETVGQIEDLQSARTEAMKDFKDRLAGLADFQKKLARIIRTRVEDRMILCSVVFHTPEQGSKTIARLDTGEFVRQEPMTAGECQLNLYAPDAK